MSARTSVLRNDIAAPVMPYRGIRIKFEIMLKIAQAIVCFKTSFSKQAAMSPVEKGRFKRTRTSPVSIIFKGIIAGRYSLPMTSDMSVLLKMITGKKPTIVTIIANFKNFRTA